MTTIVLSINTLNIQHILCTNTLLHKQYPQHSMQHKVQYHVQKSMPLVPLLSHMNSVHTPSYAFNIHFNITLQFMPTDSSGLLLSGSPTKIHQYMYRNLKIHYMK